MTTSYIFTTQWLFISLSVIDTNMFYVLFLLISQQWWLRSGGLWQESRWEYIKSSLPQRQRETIHSSFILLYLSIRFTVSLHSFRCCSPLISVFLFIHFCVPFHSFLCSFSLISVFFFIHFCIPFHSFLCSFSFISVFVFIHFRVALHSLYLYLFRFFFTDC